MGWFGRDTSGGHREPLETMVGPSASVNGHLKSDGGVRIDGAFEGVIEVAGNVVIGDGARVVANITARNVTVGGALKGNIDGTGRLEILSSGEVYGDIMVGSVMINEGGVFQGTSRMRGMEQRALTAPIEGESTPVIDDSVAESRAGETIVDVTFDDDAVEVKARPAPEPDLEAAIEREVAVPDLDFDDIEPVIPDVGIADPGKGKDNRPSKKRGRRKKFD